MGEAAYDAAGEPESSKTYGIRPRRSSRRAPEESPEPLSPTHESTAGCDMNDRPVGVLILAVLHLVGGVLVLGVQMLLLANLDRLAEGLETVGIPPALFVIGALFTVGVLLVSGVGMPGGEPVGGGVTVVSSVTTEPDNVGRG